jgi:hypothetical protein
MTINFPIGAGERELSADDNVACQAFARCENAAEGAYAHPILGAVLSCRRCAEVLTENLQPAGVIDA